MKKPKNVEQILPGIRSLLAKELINIHNVSKADVSKILGISPSAVTQYTNNKRGNFAEELGKNKQITPIIAILAEHFVNKTKKEGELRRNMTIIETSENILSILKNQNNDKNKIKNTDPNTKLLQGRVDTELHEAKISLEMANKIEDEFGKLLFKGIATDSIRHAEIVSQIIRSGNTVNKFQLDKKLKKFLKQMIEEEEDASEQSLIKIVKIKHPAVRTLLQSIDQDEIKHKKMLKSLAKHLND